MRGSIPRLLQCALTLFTLLLSVQARADVRDEVVALLASEPRRADLIVVLDTSGSMQQHFGEVKTFVRLLSSVARPGDTLTLIGFAGKANELLPPFVMRPGSAQYLKARLNKIKPPRAQYTDLGAGLEALLDALLRPNYAPLSLVFMITDFCSEPTANSPFAGGLEGGGPCRELQLTESLMKKSARLQAAGDQTVKTYALALEPASEAGLRATGEVLGPVARVDVGSGELERALDSVRTSIDYVRAGLAIEQLLKRPPLTLAAPLGPIAMQGVRDLEVGLGSRAPFPSTIRISQLRALDQSIEFEVLSPARALDLARGSGSRKPVMGAFNVRATGRESLAHGAKGESPNKPFEYTREVELELTLDLEFGPRTSIEKLRGAPARATTAIRQKVPVQFVAPDVSITPISLSVAPGFERIEVSPQTEAPLQIVVTSLTPWANLETECEIGGQRTGRLKLLPSASAASQLIIANQTSSEGMHLERHMDRQVRLTGSCVVTAISREGTRVARGSYPVALRTTLTWREGIPYLPALLTLCALLVGIALLVREVRLRVAPTALSGRLVVYAGPGQFRQVTIPLEGLVTLAVQGGTGEEDMEVRLDADRLVLPGAGPTLLELYADKRLAMRMRLVRGQATQQDQPLDSTPVRIKKGRSRFSVGGYAMRIDP